MSGTRHEGLLLLLSNCPALVRELLIGLGVALPPGDLSIESSSYSDLSPPTYSADLVLGAESAAERARVVVEIQTQIDPDKLYAWPRYAATEHARCRCPTWVLVICTDERVARWARQPIATFQPGTGFRPLVIGPADLPRITSLERALEAPELAALSAVLHRDDDDGTIAVAAIEAARTLDTERRCVYTDLICGSLNDIARAAVEAIMREREYEPLTEIGREMLAKGKLQGEAKGRTEGELTGELKGELKGMRAAIFTTCKAAGVAWSEERAQSVATMDAAALEALLATLVRDRAWPTH